MAHSVLITQSGSKTDSSFVADFLPAVVHDLKTPLNAITVFADLLQEDISGGKVSQEELLDYVCEIKKAAVDMNELVHDLLDVNSVNSGNFAVDLSKKIVVGDAIRRAVRVNRDYGLRRGINIDLIVDPDVSEMKLDEKRIKQIVSNLVSNALKYSPSKTTVKVTCKNIAPHPLVADRKPNPEFLEIAVIDQGFGMSDSQLRDIFNKYQTFNNPNSGRVDSLGLGLAIVKQLVELQNGAIEIISNPNQGTTVKVRFPYAA